MELEAEISLFAEMPEVAEEDRGNLDYEFITAVENFVTGQFGKELEKAMAELDKDKDAKVYKAFYRFPETNYDLSDYVKVEPVDTPVAETEDAVIEEEQPEEAPLDECDNQLAKTIKEALNDVEDEVECGWCFDIFPKNKCKHTKDFGYLCPDCISELGTRGRMLDFDQLDAGTAEECYACGDVVDADKGEMRHGHFFCNDCLARDMHESKTLADHRVEFMHALEDMLAEYEEKAATAEDEAEAQDFAEKAEKVKSDLETFKAAAEK